MRRGADLVRILDGRFLPNDIPELVRPVPVPGVRGFAMDSPHALANQVAAEYLPADAVDRTIESVIAFFAARRSAFQWLVHTDGEPIHLARRLADRGFSRVGSFAGMTRRDLGARIPRAADIGVRTVDRNEALRHIGILARGFGLPMAAVEAYATYRSSLPPEYRVASYLAFVAERPDPIAYGESLFAPGTATVLLGGAATEAEFRGRGAYRALLARRLSDAHAAGADTAAILAERTTSAPICARLGFREVGALEAWVWRPSSADHGAPSPTNG